jgi:hypothetical protein
VHDQVRDKLDFSFDDIGEQSVKNIARPIGVHRVNISGSKNWGLHSMGWTKCFLGEPEEAIKYFSQAMRLNPLDPLGFRAQGGIAFAHLLACRYDEAGRSMEAQKAIHRLRQIDPAIGVSTVRDWVPFRQASDLSKLQEGLLKAGLPD